jgi:4-hydroxybenzoyl-CoA thioesterase
MMFVSKQEVRFAHVDAAGIAFYPRYFEMHSAAIEDYFARQVGVSFAKMHMERRLAVPTVEIEAKFVAPSHLGDLLDFAVTVARVGRSSADLVVEIRCQDQLRFRVRSVLVCIDLKSGRSCPWPEDMKPVESIQVG